MSGKETPGYGPDPLALAQSKLRARARPVVGGTYLHYEGGLYVVVARSVDHGTLTHLVTYADAAGGCWTRRLRNFTGMVTLPNGRRLRRFALVRRGPAAAAGAAARPGGGDG